MTFMPEPDNPLEDSPPPTPPPAEVRHAALPAPLVRDAPFAYASVDDTARQRAAEARVRTANNRLGEYSIFFGVVTCVAVGVLYFFGAGLWWLYSLLGLGGVFYGVRGIGATARGTASNRPHAILGLILSLVGFIAATLYLVLVAIALANALG